MELKSFFLTYLIMPIIAVISGAVLVFVAKKNRFLNKKKLILGILVCSIVLGCLGLFGTMNLFFFPTGYVLTQLLSIGVGAIIVYLMTIKDFEDLNQKKGLVIFSNIIIILLAAFIFKLVYEALNKLDNGWWAATAIFPVILPFLFWWSYQSLLKIPSKIFKIWYYSSHAEEMNLEHLDFNKLLVLELDLYKKEQDKTHLRVKVKAPDNINFGAWFQKFIDDYNLKFKGNGVDYVNAYNESYGWIFFYKEKWFQPRKYIDPTKTIVENEIKQKHVLYAKRVHEREENTVADKHIHTFID